MHLPSSAFCITHLPVAEGAMESATRFDDSAVETKVFEVNALLVCVPQEVLAPFIS